MVDSGKLVSDFIVPLFLLAVVGFMLTGDRALLSWTAIGLSFIGALVLLLAYITDAFCRKQ